MEYVTLLGGGLHMAATTLVWSLAPGDWEKGRHETGAVIIYVRTTEAVELANMFLLVLLQLLHFSDNISFRLGLCCNVTPSNNEVSGGEGFT